MTSPLRLLAAASLSLALLLGSAGCSLIPGLGGIASTGEDLVDTSWSGEDSDGDTWRFLFQGDGTVGLTFNGDSFDDPTDTWVVEDGQLTIEIAFSDGAATLIGPYTNGSESIDLEGTQGDIEWTVTVTKG